jgi:hypothetical protein
VASVSGLGRRLVPATVALVLAIAMFFVARLPVASAGTREKLSAPYRFTEMPIALPAGYRPTATIRPVNPSFEHMKSWISSVGASIALTDLSGSGRSDDLCLVDPRTDQVVVSYAPTTPAADRFAPFVLDPAPLPTDAAMAPMGCTPGDFNLDGRMDLLVTYWGRTPVMFLARPAPAATSRARFAATELVPTESPDGKYHGPRWNTNALNVADFSGTGHPDILISNYFPDSDVLDPAGQPNVEMNSSMSNAKNGGGAHLLRWFSAGTGTAPSVQYVEEAAAIPRTAATGWTLAISSADLSGDGLPDVYIANDFGKDHLLYNRSTAGRIRFTEALGRRAPTTPKSFALGYSSFKGMGVDFADLNADGRLDMVVSNITSSWGLEESNFAWVNTTRTDAEMKAQLERGRAGFRQDAEKLGLAWTGWGWDVKTGDFLNSGDLNVVQAEGFVKGRINRWPWLQEMAMTNDNVYSNPKMWPDLQPGDDIAGRDPLAFYAKDAEGRFVNLTHQLGLATPIPSRGIAIADTRGTGALDFAVARQWGPPTFYANNAPRLGRHLTLRLYQPATGGSAAVLSSTATAPGAPAYGAGVQITGPDRRTQVSHLDGGGGHSGKRSFDVHFGLGDDAGPVAVRLRWHDSGGLLHEQELSLTPGEHTLLLDRTAEEVSAR